MAEKKCFFLHLSPQERGEGEDRAAGEGEKIAALCA
jgi:hypothetical protein